MYRLKREKVWKIYGLMNFYLMNTYKLCEKLLTDTSGQSSENKRCSVHCLTIQILTYKFFKLIPFSVT